VRELE